MSGPRRRFPEPRYQHKLVPSRYARPVNSPELRLRLLAPEIKDWSLPDRDPGQSSQRMRPGTCYQIVAGTGEIPRTELILTNPFPPHVQRWDRGSVRRSRKPLAHSHEP